MILAAFAAPLQVGDRIDTAAGSSLTLTPADGKQLELGESRTMTIALNSLDPDGSRAGTTIKLLRGLLHSLVRFAPGNALNYEVRTPNASRPHAAPTTTPITSKAKSARATRIAANSMTLPSTKARSR